MNLQFDLSPPRVSRPDWANDPTLVDAYHKLHRMTRVYTTREVVDCTLDAIGWTADRDLRTQRLLEPGAGGGAFVVEAARRLVLAARARSGSPDWSALERAIVAYEVADDAVEEIQRRTMEVLTQAGVPATKAEQLLDQWIRHRDFILTEEIDRHGSFSHVAGNPPYARWTKLPALLRDLYEAALPPPVATGDVCVPFIGRSADLLAPGGRLALIASDRWTKTQYGEGLRQHLSGRFALSAHIEIHEVSAFDRSIGTYAALSVLERRPDALADLARNNVTVFARARSIHALQTAVSEFGAGTRRTVAELTDPLDSRGPWYLGEETSVDALKKIDRQFPTLTEVGCTVRTGVTTGCNRVFFGRLSDLPVEEDLLIKAIDTADIVDGRIEWQGRWLIDAFTSEGKTVDIARYPKLAAHLTPFETILRERPRLAGISAWWRTTDKTSKAVAQSPKLLIAELATAPKLAIDHGEVQSINSIVSVTSEEWPLDALHAILSGGILGLTTSTHSTRIRGGCLRYHSRFVKMVRLPRWSDVPQQLRVRLIDSARDGKALALVTAEIYGIDPALLLPHIAHHLLPKRNVGSLFAARTDAAA